MTVAKSLIALVVLAVALASSSVTCAAHAALKSLTRGRVRRLRDAGSRGAVPLDHLAERPSRLAAVRALVVGLGYSAVAAVGAWALEQVWPDVPVWLDVALAVTAATVVMYSIGEAFPRALAMVNPEDVGLASAPWAGRIVALTFPVARLLSLVWTRLTGLITGEQGPDVPWMEADEERRVGPSDEEQSAHEDGSDDLFEAVSDLRAKIVREVMVPRTDMVTIEDTADAEEALRTITAAGVSRVPVFHDTIDDIVGILYAKDLLSRLGSGRTNERPADFARPAFFVPETKPVEELLREMRRRTHIAIVADEYGGTAGLVTIEDLLEEIVGEIYDEYDPQFVFVTGLPGGRFRVDARLPIDEFDDRFGMSLDVDADTAGGLFTELAGRIPQVGESVEVEGLRLTVEEMEGTRVRQLIVEPVPTTDEESRDD
jgi:CBS domain containing-hemolysin-like protein